MCQADPSWVELVLIGGVVTYGRADWFSALTGAAPGPSHPTVESLTAWGKAMMIDTGYQVRPAGAVGEGEGPPSLSAVRAALTAAYPPVGPIFA